MSIELSQFIVRAKRNTYASGQKAKVLEDGFEEFTFEEGEYRYRDRYHARDPEPFGGEETVWHNNEAVWMMNYYGLVVAHKEKSEKIYTFLREALTFVGWQRPFRGPKGHSRLIDGEEFRYSDESEGDVNQFKGTERIFFKGEEVYRLEYHGGKLK